MATLPDNPGVQPSAAAPDVDTLFPSKNVDELFPAEIERDRYRRQTLGTSPIQDLIFGNTEVNPVARVLDAFGQGFKSGWGSEPAGLSEESADYLKKAGIFNDYDKGQKSVIKAANESLMRGAAVGLVDPILRGLPAAFKGAQGAIAQVGEEASGTPLDTAVKAVNAAPSYVLEDTPRVGLGMENIGHEAAGALEALPTGVRAPTGIPHGVPHPAVAKLNADLAKAKSLGVIGAGEDGYFGTAPSAPAETPVAPVAVAKPVTGMPVDLFVEPRDMSAPETKSADAIAGEPAVEPKAAAEAEQPAPGIATDVSSKLVAAGRPEAEANASGQIIASHYQARAERFNGERGTAEEMYASEGPEIRSADGKAPVRSEPIKPAEGDAAAVENEPKPTLDGGAAEPIKTEPELKTALRGRAGADPQTWSLYEFLAKEGGLKPTADLKSILGGKNPFVPGFGPLLRESGLSMDEALTRAKEGSYVFDPNDLAHTGHDGTRPQAGELTKTANDLQDMISEESRGRKNYRTNFEPQTKIDPDKQAHDILAELHHEVEAVGGKVDPALEKRVVEIMTKEGETDVHSAYERAIMEDHDKHEALLNERRSTHGERDGYDHDGGSASRSSEELARESRTAEPSAKDAREADGGQSRDHGEDDRAAEEQLDRAFNQIKRGKINLRADAKPVITLFKDANASTFLHETGHQWLEELMADSEHPKAPAELKQDAITVLDWLGVKTADQIKTSHAWLEELMKDAEHPKAPPELRDDADTVREWLGVHSAEDIKTSHHEKFARGFERYMMEGKAPNQALAGVFAKFRDWLTRIYQTVNRLKSPINDEIRGVFDRLLTLHPEDVKIEPESPGKSFADIHEADAEHTPPEMAHPAAETIEGERDSVAARHISEDNDARLKNTPDEARRSEAGNQQSASDADAARSDAGEAGNAEASGEVGAGGIEVAPEGSPTPKVARTEPPVGAHDKFPDKAGNIRLDNLNTPEELNQIIRQTAEDNGDFQNVRGPVSDAQVLDLAEAAGVDAAFIDSRKLGEAWTAPQIVALRRLLIQSAQSVHDLAIKAASGTDADVVAYAQAKARHQLIQERVSSVTAEAGRALRAFQSKFTDGVAGDVSNFLKDATGKTLFQLQQEAKFLSKLQTPQQTSKFINDTSKGTFRNAILEYYINSLISGPVTHTRYIVSNAINAIFTPLVEIPLAAAVGKVREIAKGEPIERVHFGEAGAQLYGMIKGSRDGLYAAIDAFTSGVSPPLPNEKISAHFAEASHAIPGRIGQVIRLPGRSVAGIHSFFKALRYEQNVQALAYREAANEGLKGDAFSNRVAELTTSPTEAMMTDATNNALKELYMSPTGYHSSLGGLIRFTNTPSVLGTTAKIIVPFMKIGSQITRNAFMERTPLGLLDRKVRSSLSGDLGGGELDLQAGKITAGVALMATSVGLMAEGMMTGDGPEDPAKRAVWLLSHTPASIQIGDINFKYGNTGPLGMLMRFAANTYETAEHMGDTDLSTLAVSFFEGLGKSVLDETFLRGVKDALDAMFHPKEYGGNYIKNQITNWMPWSVGSSQVARKIDPFQRETHGIWQAAQAKIPWLSEGLMPRRDMFGEPILNAGPNPDYANDPVVKAMDELHVGVGKMDKKIRGVTVTEQQYDDVSRIAGRMAKMKLNAQVNLISNPNIPAATRIDMIHTAISSSREAARTEVMIRSMGGPDDIVKQATDAKRAQLRKPETVH